MALNIGKLCFGTTKKTLLSNFPNDKFLNIRSFRKIKPTKETKTQTKINHRSIETPFYNAQGSANYNLKALVKPFIFTIGFSGATLIGCTIWEYEDYRAKAFRAISKSTKFFKRKTEQNATLKEITNWWNSLPNGEKMFIPICAINLIVFAAWKVPRFQYFMLKYFASNPTGSSQCLPMILSTFSHYSGFHLLANMYVLHSFIPGVVHDTGKFQFLSLYLNAGVISSFTSYLHKVLLKQSGLSLGASGSIMAVLTYVCVQYPDVKLGIILVPFFSFSAAAALKFILGLDTLGVLLGWKLFDHAAHLGGALTGICWALWGNQYIWSKRDVIARYWHDIRGSF